jgi:hypothetical protein
VVAELVCNRRLDVAVWMRWNYQIGCRAGVTNVTLKIS